MCRIAPSFRVRGFVVLLLVAALWAVFTSKNVRGADAKSAPQPPAALRVQSFDKVPEEKAAWGSLRWLMNGKLEPGAGITLGDVTINAGQSNPLHVHGNSEEVIYVLSGSCEHRVGKQMVILKAGDVLRIPAGVPHVAKALGKEPMRAIVVYNTGERQFTPVEEGGKP